MARPRLLLRVLCGESAVVAPVDVNDEKKRKELSPRITRMGTDQRRKRIGFLGICFPIRSASPVSYPCKSVQSVVNPLRFPSPLNPPQRGRARREVRVIIAQCQRGKQPGAASFEPDVPLLACPAVSDGSRARLGEPAVALAGGSELASVLEEGADFDGGGFAGEDAGEGILGGDAYVRANRTRASVTTITSSSPIPRASSYTEKTSWF